MKLKNKLLPLVGISAVAATVAPIALTSCNSKTKAANTITLVTSQKKWTITGKTTIELKFKLANELSDDQTLKGPLFPGILPTYHNACFFSDATWVVDGLNATATLTFSSNEFTKQTPEAGSYIKCSKVNFSIMGKTGGAISTATIENFEVYW